MWSRALLRLACLLAILFVSACAGRPREVAPAIATTALPLSSIRFHASYPATLLYALDGAAGESNRDAGYRAWLVGDEPAPWLDAYAERRRAWGEAVRPDPGGGAPAFDVCGWEARELDEAIRCIENVVGPEDRDIATRALREADRRLRGRWSEVGPRITGLLPVLERALRSPKATALLDQLRRESALPADVPLRFEVVLVAKPPGDHTYARQAGVFLVHEVGSQDPAEEILPIAFHEIAHLAHAMSPRRQEMERAFLAYGEQGWLAANVWDEVVATAFGNGLAGEQLDPGFRAERRFYSDRWVDRLGRALYREWRGGLDVRLGPDLAGTLARLVEREWPEGDRALGRFLWYVNVHAPDRDIARLALRGVAYRSASRMTPIDDALPAGPDQPSWAPHYVLITADELARRESLLARAGITRGSWEEPLARGEAAVFRHDDTGGAVFVVVARTGAALGGAASAFTKRSRMVPPGWTALSPVP